MRMGMDTQILIRNGVRRVLMGTAEITGTQVIVPATAVTFAKLRYHRVAQRYVERTIEYEMDQRRETPDEEALGLRVHDRLEQVCAGFAAWLDAEPLRNDAMFRIGERTRRAQGLAMEFARAKVVRDEKDTRWGIGEDPYMLAEALEAGAHWVASENFETIERDEMEEWLERAQAKGRYLQVPRPFILNADQAMRKMMASTGEALGGDDVEEGRWWRRTIVNAVSIPNDPRVETARRLVIVGKMARDLDRGDMRRTAEEVRQWHRRMNREMERGRVRNVADEIGAMDSAMPAERVERTRRAEDRRMLLEDGGQGTPEAKRGTDGGRR